MPYFANNEPLDVLVPPVAYISGNCEFHAMTSNLIGVPEPTGLSKSGFGNLLVVVTFC